MAEQTGNLGLVIHARVGYVGQKQISPSGAFRDREHNREYGYWKGSRLKELDNRFELSSKMEGSGVYGGKPLIPIVKTSGTDTASGVCSSYTATYIWVAATSSWEEQASECFYAGAIADGCVGSPPTSPGSVDSETRAGTCSGSTSSTTSSVFAEGSSSWVKAGYLKSDLGIESPQQRTLYLGQNGYVNFGSGVACGSQEFTAYAKFVPSGSPADVVILSSHESDPAQFVLGIDGLSRYYIRSDEKVANQYVPRYARSSKKVEEYDFPTQVFGTYQSGALRLYVNGKNVGVSQAFTRDTRDYKTSDLFLGKSNILRDSASFVGWFDEMGVACTGFKPKHIENYYDSTFNLGAVIRECAPPTSGAYTAEEFDGPAFDSYDSDYLEFVATSGGGSYDLNSWKQHEHAISSDILFTFQDITPNLFQLANDIKVETWVEHITNHGSGANLYASIVNDGAEDGKTSLDWSADSYAYIPSGGKTKIVLSGVLPKTVHHLAGGSFLEDMKKNKLRLTVHYPSQNDPHNSEFRIYSTKVKYKSFESFTRPTSDMPLYSSGGSYVKDSGVIPLFMDVAAAVQSMPLTLNPELVSSLSHTGGGFVSGLATIFKSGDMPLYIAGGHRSSHLNLFMGAGSFTNLNKTMHLRTKGGEFAFPFLSKTMPLLLRADEGNGSSDGSLFLSIPSVGNASISAIKTLFVIGKRFFSIMPMTLLGPSLETETQYLYTTGPDNVSHSGAMKLFLKQRKDFNGGSSIGALGTILMNSGVPLYMSGLGAVSGIMPLVMPSSIGRINTTQNLYTEGYQ